MSVSLKKRALSSISESMGVYGIGAGATVCHMTLPRSLPGGEGDTTGIGCFPAWGNWWEMNVSRTHFSRISLDFPCL